MEEKSRFKKALEDFDNLTPEERQQRVRGSAKECARLVRGRPAVHLRESRKDAD